jgi:hypothetical protein
MQGGFVVFIKEGAALVERLISNHYLQLLSYAMLSSKRHELNEFFIVANQILILTAKCSLTVQ